MCQFIACLRQAGSGVSQRTQSQPAAGHAENAKETLTIIKDFIKIWKILCALCSAEGGLAFFAILPNSQPQAGFPLAH